MKSKGLTFALVLLLASFAAPAQEEGATSADRRAAHTPGLRQSVYEEMQEIQALAENDQVAEAQARLRALQETELSGYELAQTWFVMGYVHFQKEEFEAAQSAYEKVLEFEALPYGMQTNVLKTLAQLSMMNENFDQALTYLDRLMAIWETPEASVHALKAQSHYQLEQYDAALEALERAEQLEAEQGRVSKESWLLLKNAIYYQREDLDAMLGVVRQLVRHYPRDRYLLNMAAIYGELGDNRRQLSLMEPLYERGSLTTQSHKVNLASLYLLNEIPVKAARLLEREMELGTVEDSETHLEMLAQAWMAAANLEAAIEPLERAAELSGDGENYLVLARTQMTLTRWADAERSVGEAIAKGGLKDVSEAYLLQGMARYNQKEFRAARSSFAQAGENPASAELAQRWMEYLEREEEKQALLQGRSTDS